MKKVFLIILFSLLTLNIFSQEKLTASLYFYVNTDNVIENEDYHMFKNFVLPYIRNNINSIDKLTVIGSASPEGNKEKNKLLAISRANKIKTYLDSVPEEKVETYYTTDNYGIFNEYGKKIESVSKETYDKLRTSYLVITFKKGYEKTVTDTVFVNVDKVTYVEKIDTVYAVNLINPVKNVKQPFISIKTNLVTDVIALPSLSLGFYLNFWGLSVDSEVSCGEVNLKETSSTIMNGVLIVKKHLNNSYVGSSIGVYGEYGKLDIKKEIDKSCFGRTYGCGVQYAYSIPLIRNKKLKLEPFIRIGWNHFDYNNSKEKINCEIVYSSENIVLGFYYNGYINSRDYFGLTMIGLNLSYDITF